jgi:ERCC4-type nuclease
MIAESHPKQRTVKLFIRADPELGCERRKQAVVERLVELDDADQIREYDVNIWTKQIRISGPLEGTSYYQRVFDHFTSFQQWAKAESVSLQSAFKIQSLDCEITDENYGVLSLPCVCVAVYEEDELSGVYPLVDDGTVRTVGSCLETLEETSQLEYAD